ncbi:TPA: nicotinamide mononucleotide transporter [Klebsiella variicola subsp. variicola]|nr:nicotinamide mononucleotide transporter [Klebsiella variicola subsp. variicola]
MDFFSTQNILVHIPIGAGGYDLSWIEAVGTIAGLLCIWLAACVVAIGLLTLFINPFFAFLTRIAVSLMQALGLQVSMPVLQPDAFPFWDSCMTVLSVVAMILMTRKYVENWLLWVIVNVISVVIFARQGVYAMSLEYLLLTFIALNGSRMWINSARERGSHAFSG